jgi:photosystem II stability/assembly factor-like uncharacterized protein
MIKKNFIKLTAMLCVLIASTAIHANTGLFFNVSTHDSYLNITSTINHTYPFAGIKINTPGHSIDPTNAGCSPNSNGYCVFQVSKTQTARIRLSVAPGPFNFTLCLTARSEIPLSCQNYSTELTFLYAAMASGIIQKTVDDGMTWISSSAPDGFPVSGIFLENNILYAGTYNGNVATSNNYGASWNSVVAASDNPIFGLAVTGDNTVYAATNNGITISKDGGLTWPTPLILTAIIPSFGIFNTSNGILYRASSDGNVSVSANHGNTWIKLNPPNGSAVYGIIQSNNKLYAATDNGNVEISTNNGQSWTATALPPDPGHSAVYAIFVTASGLIYAATANGNLVLSKDQGNTWNTIMQSNSANPVLGIFVK